MNEGIIFDVPSNKDFRLSDIPVHHDQRDHSRHSLRKTTHSIKHLPGGITTTHEATNSSDNTYAKRRNRNEEGSIHHGQDLEHVRRMTYKQIRLKIKSSLQKKHNSVFLSYESFHLSFLLYTLLKNIKLEKEIISSTKCQYHFMNYLLIFKAFFK